ncbi:methylamine utilization protein [uncultured Sphingomonas sp.]|uniref:methylamine utilization protein n=1 Tax=uncultured Sphingomonas sp. TaxID=158754 RepID=UPI0035CA1BE3
MFRRSALVALASVATPAAAAPVAITVQGPGGEPLAGAVVTIEVPGRAAPAPRGAYLIEQRDIQFQPRVLIVPVGATVGFPNRDKVRHHVYSFSRPKKFDLRLYGREDTRSVVFDKPGPVALGCNIHDLMSGFVFVTATPFAAQAGTTGRVAWTDVPAGGAVMRVWHPSIRAPGNSLSRPIAVGTAGYATTVTIGR